MKLLDHVLKIRNIISRAISNRFERLGLTDIPDAHEPALTEDDLALRRRLKAIIDYHAQTATDYAEARKKAVNECTFTLFNRLAAIKVMEDKEFFPEILMRRDENGKRSFEHNAWLEEHPDRRSEEREGLIPFCLDMFDRLSGDFPIFRDDHPYALMPRADELNEIIDTINAVAADPDCGEDIWRGDDILGWLYENFNAVEKVALKESGAKTEHDKVSLQSQVYTPQWVVKFLVDNTVGKMYLEMFPDSRIDSMEDEETGEIKYRIANRPTERTRNVKSLEKWRIIDPACGSGNFLIYTMSLLYDLYLDQMENFGEDYSRRDIPAMIVENNLYGVDLDERAVQLSQIALRIKARELGGRRFRSPKHTNIVCSNFVLPNYDTVRHMVEWSDWDKVQCETVEKVWTDLAQASKFGSLVRVEQPIRELAERQSIANEGLFAGEDETSLFNFRLNAVAGIRDSFRRYVSTDAYTSTKIEDAIKFLDIICQPFDVAVANPPYTDSGDFGPELKAFVEENYRRPYKFHTNLYATFIRRCWELTAENGKVGMIHPMTFMYIKSFEDVRKFMLENTHINLFVEYGLSNLFGSVMVDPAFYTFDKGESNEESIFMSYDQYTRTPEEKRKKEYCLSDLVDLCEGRETSRVYHLPQDKLRQIKSWPFIYWISDDFRKKFSEETVEDFIDVVKGLTTSDNEQFLRFWWEINSEDISEDYQNDEKKWVRYAKGGPYNKWYGNLWCVLNWENNGQPIKDYAASVVRNENYYFREGLTYSAAGSKGVTFRYLPKNSIIDAGGPGAYMNKFTNVNYSLGFFNTKVVYYICDCLNPTVNINQGDLWRVPFVVPTPSQEVTVANLSEINAKIKKHLCEYSLVEFNFKQSPIQPGAKSAAECVADYFTYENGLLTQVLLNEAIINREVFDIYDLTERDRKMVLDKEGVPVGDLSVSEIAKTCYLEFLRQNTQFPASAELLEHINALPVSDEQPSLDFTTLYQKNNDWEEYCIKNSVNPIEAWYQFNGAATLPAQRTQVLAFELITDVIRTLLEKDNDGIIPLVERAGEGMLADRIQQELMERGYTGAQFSQICQLLGMPLDRYLRDRFFAQLSDHLNLFMYLPKTPFIWHLTSGPLHAMEVYVSIYRWNRNSVSRVKSVYCANRESALRDRLATLTQSDEAAAQSEAADIRAQLRELADFTARLDSLLASGYDPKLDDGVGKNIAPLQQAGLLSYAVLKETGGKKSQLNKFLEL